MVSQSVITALLILLAVDFSSSDRSRRQPVKLGGFIVRGTETYPHRYPWTVHIIVRWEDGKRSLCGGSLITPNKVLTAGHCTEEISFFDNRKIFASEFTVTLGVHNIAADEATETGRKIFNLTMNDVHVHPNFTYLGQKNDIAVLMLPESIEMGATIKSITLPDRQMCSEKFNSLRKYGRECKKLITTGWGVTQDQVSSQVLQEIEVRSKPPSKCLDYFEVFNRNLQICGLGVNGSDSCSGDSGGPLMCVLESGSVLVGLTSAGSIQCSMTVHTPGIYTQLCGYLDWLDSLPCGNLRKEKYGKWTIEDSAIANLECEYGLEEAGTTESMFCSNGEWKWFGEIGSCKKPEIPNTNQTSDDPCITMSGIHSKISVQGHPCNFTNITSEPGTCRIPFDASTEYRPRKASSRLFDDVFIKSGLRIRAICRRSDWKLSGPTFSRCLANGTWDPPASRCTNSPSIPSSSPSPFRVHEITSSPTTTLAQTSKCSKPLTNGDWSVYGIYDVEENEMPWIARIKIVGRGSQPDKYCSGSLIDKEWVLTSASCFNVTNPDHIFVKLGRTNFSGTQQQSQNRISKAYFIHDQYNVALIKLNRQIWPRSNAKPICMPDDICAMAETIDNCDDVVVGTWNVSNSTGDLSKPVLKRLTMNILPQSTCSNKARRRRAPIGNEQFCASNSRQGDIACDGDDGGPMICQVGSNVYLAGLVSMNRNSKCGLLGGATFFSRVCSVLPWIQEKIRSP